MANKINPITEAQRATLQGLSVQNLPDRPADYGKTATDVKNAMTDPLFSNANSLFDLLKNAVDELNTMFNGDADTELALVTSAQTLIGAINELKNKISDVADGEYTALATNETNSLIEAINELKTKITGNISGYTALTTTATNDRGAINELDAELNEATAEATANKLAKRDSIGRIKVAAPYAASGNYAVNVDYLNTRIAKLDEATSEADAGTVMKRDANGGTKVVTDGAEEQSAVNVSYAEAQFGNARDKVASATPNATPNTIVKRNRSGIINVGTPINDGSDAQAVNLGYVGKTSLLNTTSKTSFTGAINELVTNISALETSLNQKINGYSRTFYCASWADVKDALEGASTLIGDNGVGVPLSELNTGDLVCCYNDNNTKRPDYWFRKDTSADGTGAETYDNTPLYKANVGYLYQINIDTTEIQGYVTTAEAYAKGTINGVAVSEGQTGYQNNAKYYATQASGSAGSAEDSAELAEAYAKGTVNGTPVGEGEAGDDDNALHYKNLASNYATSAQGYANEAKNYAEQAGDTVEANAVCVIKITDTTTTLGDMATQLNAINSAGRHIDFDVSALGAGMYLTNIYIDSDKYVIFDRVKGRIATGAYSSDKLLTMAIANANDIATQSQIDSLQHQINELGGSSLIDDWDSLGEAILAGTSTDYIEAGDTIDVNWIATVLGTSSVSGNSVTCSDLQAFTTKIGEAEATTYYFVYDGSNWTLDEATVTLSQYGLTFSGTAQAGEVLSITTTVTTRNYTFVSYDTATPKDAGVSHNWLLEQTYAPDTKAYDAIEALIHLVQGNTITAGNYYFSTYLQGTSTAVTRYFTIASDLTATDADIQIAPTATNWTSPYIPTSMTPYYIGLTTALGSAISLSADALSDAVDISTVTGVTVSGSTYQSAFGNNCWELSNIRQWLNDAHASGGYSATHEFDRPSSYNNGKGFLYCIDPRVLVLIQECAVSCTAGYNNGSHTQGSTYTVDDKVFLLSMKEMSFSINTSEGTMTQLYGSYTNSTLTNGAVASRTKYNKAGGSVNSYRWSRSARSGFSFDARLVTSSGAHDNHYASFGIYFAPAFIIGKSST